MLNPPDSEEAPSWVTAIDIALIPDVTLIRQTIALDERLNEARDVNSLDAAYLLRLTTLQCYVQTRNLRDVYGAAGAVLRAADPAAWQLNAIGYEAVEQDDGSAVVRLLVRPDDAWLSMQHELIFALVPHFSLAGADESFVTNGDEVDPAAIERVSAFIPNETGARFRPHVEIGVGSAANARAIVAEPFEPFTFRPGAAAIYHLGGDVTTHMLLKSWPFPYDEADFNPEAPYRAWKPSQEQRGA